MRLSSLEFVLFLGLVAAVYHASRGRAAQWLLLAASALFYASFLQPLWFAALAAVIVVTWASGLAIDKSVESGRDLVWLWAGCGFGLALLCVLRYSGLGAEALNLVLQWRGSSWRCQVPQPLLYIGLSYYVFQSISYLADIHFQTQRAERSLAWVALTLSFFPKVVQGPIERAKNLVPQLKAPYVYDPALLRRGCLLFCWGLFKKVVVAERLALMVDAVFHNLGSQQAPALLAGAWLFFLQLFCDFSGYTDMALGAACFFNVTLTDNFDEPYMARSMKDFWRRWHITLSTWILDYVFQPLQMAFRYWGSAGLALAIFISFFLMGLWHGATDAYVAFGLVQGLLMAAATLYRPWQKKLHAALGIAKSPWLAPWQIFFTLNLVVLSFVLFRAGSLANAAVFYRGLAHGWANGDLGALVQPLDGAGEAWILGLGLASCAAGEILRRRRALRMLPTWARWSGYAGLLGCLLLFGRFYAQKQFIYAQF
jgi:alginate O-acetyltransferase complex protein AlgI